MKLISTLIICLGLSACATDYASQLSEPNYGIRSLHIADDADPVLLMNGTYASKQLHGFYVSKPYGALSQQPPSGWDP